MRTVARFRHPWIVGLWLLAWLVVLHQGGLRSAARTFLSLTHAHLEIPAIDLYQDWAAGRDHFLGDSIYAPLAKNHARHRPHLGLPSAPEEPILKRNAHPPTMTLLVLGLAHLEYRTAFLLWSWLGVILLLVSVHLVLRELWSGGMLATFGLALLLTSAYPVSRQFQYGNVQMVLLGLVTGAWVADRRGHCWLAGVLVGLAAGVKLYPAFLVLYFVALGRWRSVLGAALSFTVLVAGAGIVFGLGSFGEFVTEAMPAIATYRSDPPNISLPGLWFKLFDPGTHIPTAPLVQARWIAVLLILASFVAVTSLFLLAARAVRRHLADSDMLFGLGVLAMLLLSPATWPHGQCLLLVPVAVLLSRLPRDRLAWHVVIGILWVIWIPWPAVIGWRLHPEGAETTYQVWESLTWTSLRLYATLGLLAVQRESLPG